jgi:glycosyltransferase involved in cell wall biosynthesis
LKLLIVSQYFRPEPFRVNDLAAELVRRGHRVVVLTGLPNYPGGRLFPGYSWRGPYRERFDGYDVVRVPLLPRGRGGPRLALNYLSFAGMASAIAPWRLREPLDAALVYAPSPITACIPALWLKRLRGVPVALWVQDLWPESLAATGAVRSPALLRVFGSMVRRIYRGCDLVLGQSAAFVRAIRQLCPEVRRVELLPNWCEDFYRPLELEADAAERRELPGAFTLLFAGSLGAAQSLDTIVGAARLLRDQPIHWAFLGDGRRREWLEATIAELDLGERVHYLGWRPADRMPRYLAAADGLVVTLRREPIFEATIPAKVQSSLAVGRPILAGLSGEPAAVLEASGAAIVVPPDDSEALADGAMRLFRATAQERAAMGVRGRAYAERHYDRDALITRLEGWMEELGRGGR